MTQHTMLMCHSLMGMQVYNYPVVNHGRMRGLLQRLRSRLLSLQGERAALQQQLTELPLDTEDSQAPLRTRVDPLLMRVLPSSCLSCASSSALASSTMCQHRNGLVIELMTAR